MKKMLPGDAEAEPQYPPLQWESLDSSLDNTQCHRPVLLLVWATPPSPAPVPSLPLRQSPGCQPPCSPSSSGGTSQLSSNCSWLWQRWAQDCCPPSVA